MSRILIACEFSGVVRDAFASSGHNHFVASCDLLESESPGGRHYQCDVRQILAPCLFNDWKPWDLLIAHPPCTYLTRAGARWWKGREREQEEALAFVRTLLDAPIHRIALENPPGRIGTAIRKADQTIQPWQFGHGETKATSLWLKNLPPLEPTNIVEGREPRVHFAAPRPDRWKNRSRTLAGIAAAMAAQWGDLL